MRRLLVAAAVVLTVTAVITVSARPTPARALPASDLCVPDGARGGVPADFVIDACVDAGSLTLRNDLGRPVLVRGSGDVGEPVHLHERDSPNASVLRLVSEGDELLMPGDVTRWPVGATAATVDVVDVDPLTRSVVDSFTASLPALGSGSENTGDVAAVARELIAALHDRGACVEGKNFLQAASCDVDGAYRISRALKAHLPRSTARHLLSVALDRARWAAWSAPAMPTPADSGPRGAAVARSLTLAALPRPMVLSDPAVDVPAPVGSTPRVVVTPPPAPAPAVPAAPPVAAAVPPAPPRRPSPQEWLAAVLQQLADRKNSPGPSTSDANGKGNGHENGRGHK